VAARAASCTARALTPVPSAAFVVLALVAFAAVIFAAPVVFVAPVLPAPVDFADPAPAAGFAGGLACFDLLAAGVLLAGSLGVCGRLLIGALLPGSRRNENPRGGSFTGLSSGRPDRRPAGA